MAWRQGNLPFWLENAADPSQSQSNAVQTDQLSAGAAFNFNQLLEQLNASQSQTTGRWNPGSWHDDAQSTDSTVDVTSPLSTVQSSAAALSSVAAPSGHAANWLGTHLFHHSHHQAPDHPGTLTVTSSGSGFAEGDIVTAHVADPDGVNAATVSYQWSSIGPDQVSHPVGTNSASYTLTAGDVGNQIDVVATYIDLKGHHGTAADPFTVTDPTIPDPTPANSPGVLSVSSTNGFVEGATLTASVSDADGFDAASVVYTWQQQKNGVWTDVGTGQSHPIGFNDGGNDFRVLATYTDAAGNPEAPAPVAFTAVDVDQAGALTVTSSGSGFAEGDVVTAHVTDPDGVDLGAITYQWSSMGADQLWHPIGTNSESYTLTAADGGKQIDVVATYVDQQGHAGTAADPFTVAAPVIPDPPPPPPPPTNSPGVLSVTSTNGFNEGAVLTANVSDADGLGAVPVVYTWQEQINNTWTNVGTGQTHTIGFNDGGNNFRVLASYTDGAGHAEAPPPVAFAAVDVNQPGIVTVTSSGSGFVEGATLTAKVTDADGLGAAAILYTWQEQVGNAWTNVGTGQTHAHGVNDGGNNFRVVASYTDAAGHAETPQSAVIPVIDINQNGIVTVTSSGSGFVEGATLTAKVTDADGLGAAAILYTWQEQVGNTWTNVGTGQTHALGFSDGGNNFRVVTSYTDAAGHAETPQSAVIPAVDVDRAGTLTVSSSGSGFAQGDVITANVSDPDGISAGAVSYQWSSMGTDNLWHAITGATAASYTLAATDAGHQIDVVATYVDNQGHHDTATDPFTVSAPVVTPPSSSGFFIGVNLSGAEQSWRTYPNEALPGVAQSDNPNAFDYAVPTHAEVDYYASKGMESIRLEFLWERMQPTLDGPLDSKYLAEIKDVVDYATSKGLTVDLNPQNNPGATYHGNVIGSSAVPSSAFADLWSKLATVFHDNQNVIFGLVNEPTMDTTQWLSIANEAIAAIRDTGATQEIYVPGNNNYGPGLGPNQTILAPGIKDPLHNWALEVHMYMDPGHSGVSQVISATEGVSELTGITQWAQTAGVKLVLGEVGVGTEATDLAALSNAIGYLEQHTNVWQGVDYWAGGPIWNLFGYRLSIEPTGLGTANVVDKPQMAILESFIHPQDHMPTA